MSNVAHIFLFIVDIDVEYGVVWLADELVVAICKPVECGSGRNVRISEGNNVGIDEGFIVGISVGIMLANMVAVLVGIMVGSDVGVCVGVAVVKREGTDVGRIVGEGTVGIFDGKLDGICVRPIHSCGPEHN